MDRQRPCRTLVCAIVLLASACQAEPEKEPHPYPMLPILPLSALPAIIAAEEDFGKTEKAKRGCFSFSAEEEGDHLTVSLFPTPVKENRYRLLPSNSCGSAVTYQVTKEGVILKKSYWR